MSSQQNSKDKVKLNCEYSKDGIGVTIQALFRGMEGMLSTKTVVGEPMEAGGALIIPLIEVSAGLATGALVNSGKNKNNGAGAMSTKLSPVALLIIQDGRTKLISIKDQDVFTRLLDLIPEAIDKVKKGAVSKEIVKQAEEAYENGEVEIIEAEEPVKPKAQQPAEMDSDPKAGQAAETPAGQKSWQTAETEA